MATFTYDRWMSAAAVASGAESVPSLIAVSSVSTGVCKFMEDSVWRGGVYRVLPEGAAAQAVNRFR